MLDIAKSGRGMMHADEAGQFGESLVRLELSRAGWPLVLSCRGVGIDVLAVARSGRRIGISVKCRDRVAKNQYESIFVFRDKPGKRAAIDEILRFRRICRALKIKPWIAVVIVTPKYTYAYLTELQHFLNKYSSNNSRTKAWNMANKWRDRYAKDPDVLGNKGPDAARIWTLSKRSP